MLTLIASALISLDKNLTVIFKLIPSDFLFLGPELNQSVIKIPPE